MSKQLAISAAASTLALAALALLAPGSARLSDLGTETGAATSITAPLISLEAPELLPALPSFR